MFIRRTVRFVEVGGLSSAIVILALAALGSPIDLDLTPHSGYIVASS